MEKEDFKIYNWVMIAKNVEGKYKDLYTEGKIYEVVDGVVITNNGSTLKDKEYSLNEFLDTCDDNIVWIISKVKIGNYWYIMSE